MNYTYACCSELTTHSPKAKPPLQRFDSEFTACGSEEERQEAQVCDALSLVEVEVESHTTNTHNTHTSRREGPTISTATSSGREQPQQQELREQSTLSEILASSSSSSSSTCSKDDTGTAMDSIGISISRAGLAGGVVDKQNTTATTTAIAIETCSSGSTMMHSTRSAISYNRSQSLSLSLHSALEDEEVEDEEEEQPTSSTDSNEENKHPSPERPSSLLSKASSNARVKPTLSKGTLVVQCLSTPRHTNTSTSSSKTHGKIQYVKSPSHMKEGFEVSKKSTTESHDSGVVMDNMNDPATPKMGWRLHKSHSTTSTASTATHASGIARQQHAAFLQCQQELHRTRHHYKRSQHALHQSHQDLQELRQQAQHVQAKLLEFQHEWDAQNTLMRNKDRELERLRVLLGDRSEALTVATSALSAVRVEMQTNVSAVVQWKGLCEHHEKEALEVQTTLQETQKTLRDTQVELSRANLQLDAQASRRKQFSNQALQLLVGKKESASTTKTRVVVNDTSRQCHKNNTAINKIHHANSTDATVVASNTLAAKHKDKVDQILNEVSESTSSDVQVEVVVSSEKEDNDPEPAVIAEPDGVTTATKTDVTVEAATPKATTTAETTNKTTTPTPTPTKVTKDQASSSWDFPSASLSTASHDNHPPTHAPSTEDDLEAVKLYLQDLHSPLAKAGKRDMGAQTQLSGSVITTSTLKQQLLSCCSNDSSSSRRDRAIPKPVRTRSPSRSRAWSSDKTMEPSSVASGSVTTSSRSIRNDTTVSAPMATTATNLEFAASSSSASTTAGDEGASEEKSQENAMPVSSEVVESLVVVEPTKVHNSTSFAAQSPLSVTIENPKKLLGKDDTQFYITAVLVACLSMVLSYILRTLSSKLDASYDSNSGELCVTNPWTMVFGAACVGMLWTFAAWRMVEDTLF